MKRILLLQTGGTIAMEIRNETDEEVSGPVGKDKLLKIAPSLTELAHVEIRDLFFKDSSDVQPADWVRIADEIQGEYDHFDGFVILHGTDTMAYSASALSFCFRNLGKPVIFTGSQIPMSVLRSDAARNLINAIQMATLSFNEVAICFSDRIYRGNRCTKQSIGDFNAYISPNFPPLAEIGLNIELRYSITPSIGKFHCLKKFSEDILVISLHPGMQPSRYIPLLDDGIRAVIISAFGSGNFATSGDYSLVPLLEKCVAKNIFTVIGSQATHDSVDLNKYESGRMARDLGCLSAGDMTMEATITKMMHLLGNYDNPHQIRDLYNRPIAGELSL